MCERQDDTAEEFFSSSKNNIGPLAQSGESGIRKTSFCADERQAGAWLGMSVRMTQQRSFLVAVKIISGR